MTELSIVLFLLISTFSFAGEGGTSSGGGGAVRLSNNTVMLADAFYVKKGIEGTFECPKGEEGKLSEPLLAELRKADKLLVRYGAATNWNNQVTFDESSEFFRRSIKDARYCFVKKLPKYFSDDKLKTRSGYQSHALAYTEGAFTWILTDLFAKMPLREQAKAIVHERMHAHAGFVPHGPIVDITEGLDLAMSILDEQQRGNRPVLSSKQLDTLSTLVKRINDLHLDFNSKFDRQLNMLISDFVITPYGGGMVHKSLNLPRSTYVGVGSILNAQSEVGENVTLINSAFCPVYNIFQNQVRMSPIDKSAKYLIHSGVTLKDSWIGFCGEKAEIGANTRIENSVLSMHEENWGTRPTVGLVIGNNVSISDSAIERPTRLVLNDGVVWKNAALQIDAANDNFDREVILEVGENTTVRNLTRSGIAGGRSMVDIKSSESQPRGVLKLKSNSVFDFSNHLVCEGSPPLMFRTPRETLFIRGTNEAESVDRIRFCLCANSTYGICSNPEKVQDTFSDLYNRLNEKSTIQFTAPISLVGRNWQDHAIYFQDKVMLPEGQKPNHSRPWCELRNGNAMKNYPAQIDLHSPVEIRFPQSISFAYDDFVNGGVGIVIPIPYAGRYSAISLTCYRPGATNFNPENLSQVMKPFFELRLK